MKLYLSWGLNGEKINNYETEGNDLAECVSALPEKICDDVYRIAGEKVVERFQEVDWPLESEEEREYEKALQKALQEALDAYCDRNNYTWFAR